MTFYEKLLQKIEAMLLDSSDVDFIEYNGNKVQKTDKEKLLKIHQELSQKIAKQNGFKRVINTRM